MDKRAQHRETWTRISDRVEDLTYENVWVGVARQTKMETGLRWYEIMDRLERAWRVVSPSVSGNRL